MGNKGNNTSSGLTLLTSAPFHFPFHVYNLVDVEEKKISKSVKALSFALHRSRDLNGVYLFAYLSSLCFILGVKLQGHDILTHLWIYLFFCHLFPPNITLLTTLSVLG